MVTPTVFDLIREIEGTRDHAAADGDLAAVAYAERAIARLKAVAVVEMDRLAGWRWPGTC